MSKKEIGRVETLIGQNIKKGNSNVVNLLLAEEVCSLTPTQKLGCLAEAYEASSQLSLLKAKIPNPNISNNYFISPIELKAIGEKAKAAELRKRARKIERKENKKIIYRTSISKSSQ
jgi:hypothetical protein